MSKQRALYEVMVGYVELGRTRWIGSWLGIADSEKAAKEEAKAHVWSEERDAAGQKIDYGVVVKPRYVVAQSWGHRFVEQTESTTRWVYDRAEGDVVGEVQVGREWRAFTDAQKKDVLESIHDNNADIQPGDFELEETEQLPLWATPAQPGALVDHLVRTRCAGARP